MIEQFATAIDGYCCVRMGNYPFPIDSILGFTFALELSSDRAADADMLEIGVEFGGTALLSAQFVREAETLHLIDLKRTDRFAKSFEKLPHKVQDRISFLECSSRSAKLDFLTEKCFRFIHIDGGHSKQDVLDDALRFAHCLSSNGIVVFDDVFEIRWPGVTEALFEYLADAPIAPFLIVDRKLYCARKADHATLLSNAQAKLERLQTYGTVRSWVAPWCGSPTLIVKIVPSQVTRERFP